MPLSSLLPDLGERTLIMGILNITPDSFSDGGRFLSADAALDHALEMMDAGADIIDVGGETTRPGSDPVPIETELARVLPVVKALAKRGVGPLSIDTTKAEVARRAVLEGAAIINDISGGTFEPEILHVATTTRAPIVLMHTRGRPRQMQQEAEYQSAVIDEVLAELSHAIARAESAGVSREEIIVDPGIGFAKGPEDNLDLLADLSLLRQLGRPILIGTSRKSFIGKLTGREVREREFGTAATVAIAIAHGADIVRVHDVAAMGDVARVADAIVRRPR
jgi:dihydropteroate synthase